MKLDRKSGQGVDPPGSSEFLNGQLLSDCSKHIAVEIEILALQLKKFHALMGLFLFPHVESETSWLTAPLAGRNHMAVWFEERPEQVVCDLSIFKERDEALSG